MTTTPHFSLPGSQDQETRAAYSKLQEQFVHQYRETFHDKKAAKVVVVVPSLSLDPEILAKVQGIVHYEERLLCLLLLLRMPRTHVIYVTSTAIDPVIIDYYLHLLPGVTGDHARQRIHFFNCHDASSLPLATKILNRPRLQKRIREAIPAGYLAHMACFNVTEAERKLALQLGLPIYGCDPDLLYWGSKSGSREIFRECGLNIPPGFENLHCEQEIVQSIAKLYRQHPGLRKVVIKINEGFSGDGNAVFSLAGLDTGPGLEEMIGIRLPAELEIIPAGISYTHYMEKFSAMGGIVEAYIDGECKASPSVQCRINPLGNTDIISTHDQHMGGHDAQEFLGGAFPADPAYAAEVGALGKKVAEAMRNKGVLGRFGVDFISVKEKGSWQHYAIEINLRKGGTTHPFIMLQFLTNGDYNADTGTFTLPDGHQKCYLFTDNLQHEQLRGLIPEDLMDIAMLNGLHYDATREEGVVFHLIGALSQYGKLGLLCIASDVERAKYFYNETVRVLNLESGSRL